MPELPEVETVRRGLARAMEGRRIDGVRVARRDLRWPLPDDFETRLVGRTVTAVGRRAKYLTIGLDDGGVLLAHLGMSGRMIVDENAPDPRPPRGPHSAGESSSSARSSVRTTRGSARPRVARITCPTR